MLYIALYCLISFVNLKHIFIKNEKTNEKIVSAKITLIKNGNSIQNTTTDIDGDFRLKVDSGIYDVELFCKGFHTRRIEEVIVIEGQITELNFQLCPLQNSVFLKLL